MKRAFTLIELLVVIAIIAILAAILFPVFAQAKTAAKKTVDLSNLKQMSTALELFKADHDGYYPKAWFNDEINNEMTKVPDPLWGWDYNLQPYIKNKEVFQSNLDSETQKRGLWTTADSDLYESSLDKNGNCCDRKFIGKLGTRYKDDDIGGSYRYNMSNFPNGPYSALNESALDRPAEAIFIVPSRPGTQKANWHHITTWSNYENEYVCPNYVLNTQFDRFNNTRGTNENQYAQGLAGYSFGDTHAKALSFGAIWKGIGPVQQQNGRNVLPTMMRQNFSGWDEQCMVGDRAK